jgi:hypothetical protein
LHCAKQQVHVTAIGKDSLANNNSFSNTAVGQDLVSNRQVIIMLQLVKVLYVKTQYQTTQQLVLVL